MLICKTLEIACGVSPWEGFFLSTVQSKRCQASGSSRSCSFTVFLVSKWQPLRGSVFQLQVGDHSLIETDRWPEGWLIHAQLVAYDHIQRKNLITPGISEKWGQGKHGGDLSWKIFKDNKVGPRCTSKEGRITGHWDLANFRAEFKPLCLWPWLWVFVRATNKM